MNNIKWWKNPINIFTFVIALATVVNVGVSYFQGKIAYDQLALNKETFDLSFRPFVGLASEIVITSSDEHFHFRFWMTNFGHQPAKIIKVDWITKVSGEPTSPHTQFGDLQKVLFPNDQAGLFFNASGEGAEAIRNGHVPLSVSFGVHYQGVGQDTYETYQEFRFDHNTGGFFAVYADWK